MNYESRDTHGMYRNNRFDKELLKDAPGFDKSDWPDMADPTWAQSIHTYYGTRPYMEDVRH